MNFSSELIFLDRGLRISLWYVVADSYEIG